MSKTQCTTVSLFYNKRVAYAEQLPKVIGKLRAAVYKRSTVVEIQ